MLDLEFVSDAEPAAVFARPLAVRRQTKAAHDDRRLGFQHLDRHIAQKRDAHLGPRDAVALAARAGAARDRVRDDDPPGAAQFRGRDIGDHEDTRSRDRHLARDRLCQCAQHEIVHPHRRREAHAARRREAGIDDRRFRKHEVDAAQNAGVDVDRLGFGQHIIHCRHREERVVIHVAGRQVQSGAHLRIRAGVVELDRPIASHRQLDDDADRYIADVIVLEIFGEGVGSLRELRQHRAGQRLGAVQGRIHRAPNLSPPIALGQPLHPRLSLRQCRDAGGHIAPIQRGDAAIVRKQVPHFLVQHAPLEQLDRTHAQAFLEHLRVLHVDASGRIAADIGTMDKGPGETQQLAIDEHRPERVDVVQMHDHAARRVRIICDDDIALLPGDPLRYRIHRDAHQHRRAAAIGIGEHLTLGRDERDTEILRLFDKGRV